VAKTAFGYSANEVMAQLGQQQRSNPGSQPPPARSNPASQPPPSRPNPGSQPPPVGYQQSSGLAPQAAATAATMFVPGGGVQPPQPPAYSPPQPAYTPPVAGYPPAPAPAPYTPPGPSGGMGIHSPQQATPAALPRVVSAPYAPTGAVPTLRPNEPWRQSLKLMMFVWGAVALAAFAVPTSTDPMVFNWDAILHAEGKEKIPSLVWASVALLSIVFAAIPMASLARGALAAVLGLAGVFVPMAIGTFPEWQDLLPLIGALAIVTGLLVRNEYKESLTARVIVTLGVIFTLAPYLLPHDGQIPLVLLFKALLNAGNHMELVIIPLAHIVLAVLCLLVWMPGPGSAGAKIFAWAVILFPVAVFALLLVGDGHIGDVASKEPGKLLMWVVGVEKFPFAGVAYAVLVGYGLATVIGKQLE
jgi:hypothetical protein